VTQRDLPPRIDAALAPHVSVALAARYLGRSPRWVQRAVLDRRLQAIDIAPPGAKRPSWAIAVHELRRFVAMAEAQAEKRIRADEDRRRALRDGDTGFAADGPAIRDRFQTEFGQDT